MKAVRFVAELAAAVVFTVLIFAIFLPAHLREWRLRRQLGDYYEGEDES
mgnify:CR=1 FL=1